jgi:hypothetical protein
VEAKAEWRQSSPERPNRAATGGNDGLFKLSFFCGYLYGPRDFGDAGSGAGRRAVRQISAVAR